jgi:hypothetical protein
VLVGDQRFENFDYSVEFAVELKENLARSWNRVTLRLWSFYSIIWFAPAFFFTTSVSGSTMRQWGTNIPTISLMVVLVNGPFRGRATGTLLQVTIPLCKCERMKSYRTWPRRWCFYEKQAIGKSASQSGLVQAGGDAGHSSRTVLLTA